MENKIIYVTSNLICFNRHFSEDSFPVYEEKIYSVSCLDSPALTAPAALCSLFHRTVPDYVTDGQTLLFESLTGQLFENFLVNI
jgi:hypothetical protein